MDFITDVCWHGASSCADERNIAGNFIGIAATLPFFKRAPFFALSLSFFFFVSALLKKGIFGKKVLIEVVSRI